MTIDKYVVLDVEKANHQHDSICQIGLVVIENHKVVQEYLTYVNPKQGFLSIHTSIHGIVSTDVEHSPTMEELKPELLNIFSNAVVCSYGSSDKFAIGSFIDVSMIKWIDIYKMVRNSLPELRESGFSLKKVCSSLGLGTQSDLHNALEDAILAGRVLDHLIHTVKTDPNGYASLSPLNKSKPKKTLHLL